MAPLDFLQQHGVHPGSLQLLLDPVEHEIAIVAIESLVDVVGQNIEHTAWRRM